MGGMMGGVLSLLLAITLAGIIGWGVDRDQRRR